MSAQDPRGLNLVMVSLPRQKPSDQSRIRSSAGAPERKKPRPEGVRTFVAGPEDQDAVPPAAPPCQLSKLNVIGRQYRHEVSGMTHDSLVLFAYSSRGPAFLGLGQEDEQKRLDSFNGRLRAGGHVPDLTAASARHDGEAAKDQRSVDEACFDPKETCKERTTKPQSSILEFVLHVHHLWTVGVYLHLKQLLAHHRGAFLVQQGLNRSKKGLNLKIMFP